MPHTNRKKRASGATTTSNTTRPKMVHKKRYEIEDDEGWTHIIPTCRKTIRAGLEFLGGFIDENSDRTLGEAMEDYDRSLKQWENSDACAGLKKLLLASAQGKVLVENVVCLGLGSLQGFGARTSYTQLVALRTILDVLGIEATRCVFQDPAFNAMDKELLTSLGYTVVDDPVAFGHISENSLVYALHCYVGIYKSVSDAPRPALLIVTDMTNFENFGRSSGITDAIEKSLRDMVLGCEEIDFPQARLDFSDTKLYWRKLTTTNQQTS